MILICTLQQSNIAGFCRHVTDRYLFDVNFSVFFKHRLSCFYESFGLGADIVAWLTTGFMLVMTLMIPVSPWLLHNVTFQRLFQAIELIFAIGTGLCIWAPSFTALMIGRLLEAIAVGIIFRVSRPCC